MRVKTELLKRLEETIDHSDDAVLEDNIRRALVFIAAVVVDFPTLLWWIFPTG